MYTKTLCIALVAFIVFNVIDAKKTRRTKRPKDGEETTPQPSVVSYSTFGFNDVGSYDGFVPSSPDYANYLSGSHNQESTTRLYAPAFPTAMEAASYDNNYSPTYEEPVNDDGSPQSSMLHYQPNSFSFYNTPSIDNNQRIITSEEIYRQNNEEENGVVYGTKLSSRNINKPYGAFNNSAINVFSSGPSSPSDEKASQFNDVQSTQESNPTLYGESSNNYQNIYGYAPYPPTIYDEYMKNTPNSNPLKYQKVIDFTKSAKQYYPTELHTDTRASSNAISQMSSTASGPYSAVSNINHEIVHTNSDNGNKLTVTPQPPHEYKVIEDDQEKDLEKPSPNPSQDFSNSYSDFTNNKNSVKGSKYSPDYKDKLKTKPSSYNNNDYKNWKNPLKVYEYSTDFSNTSFKYDFTGLKKPLASTNDEVIPASSNVIDLTNYQFPEKDFSNLKKIPGVKAHYEDDNDNVQLFKPNPNYRPDEYLNQFKNLYNKPPTDTTNWGNVFKSSDFTSYKHHKKPQISEDLNDDIVHIPKRLPGSKPASGKYFEGKYDWPSFNKRPSKPTSEWGKESSSNRYKSEEDLLGLRTHDTSHPSYLPSYKPINLVPDDNDYKKLVEKWRQSYMKAKYKDSPFRDYESYASESKPMHVPVPKLYPIEIPHPVIVPVPQPYPVRVPIPKPVAVPIVQEIRVAIEKPVPYAVFKKVPFPVEKPVPVTVEKKVPVPVIKPYPVAVPHIRPVFHHSKPSSDDFESEPEEEDDYMPRPETSKRIPYTKRPRSVRNRPRRPSRMVYQDRNRRRWPVRRPTVSRQREQDSRKDQRPLKRPQNSAEYHRPHYREFDNEYERSNDYYSYCKRTGNC